MNVKEIKQLLELVKEHELAEFELEREGFRISLKKYGAPTLTAGTQFLQQPMSMGPVLPAQEAPPAPEAEETDTYTITAPIVGTFYSSPSPDAAIFVSTGDKVTPNDTVCIIEAMKVMNEIKADVSGKIIETYVENGQAVEFGQPLYKVKL